MTNKNKNQDPFNSPPRSQTPRNQGIPRRATPPPVQRQQRPTTPRPTPRRVQNVNNANWLRFLNNLIQSPRSNVSNQTPLKKKPKK